MAETMPVKHLLSGLPRHQDLTELTGVVYYRPKWTRLAEVVWSPQRAYTEFGFWQSNLSYASQAGTAPCASPACDSAAGYEESRNRRRGTADLGR